MSSVCFCWWTKLCILWWSDILFEKPKNGLEYNALWLSSLHPFWTRLGEQLRLIKYVPVQKKDNYVLCVLHQLITIISGSNAFNDLRICTYHSCECTADVQVCFFVFQDVFLRVKVLCLKVNRHKTKAQQVSVHSLAVCPTVSCISVVWGWWMSDQVLTLPHLMLSWGCCVDHLCFSRIPDYDFSWDCMKKGDNQLFESIYQQKIFHCVTDLSLSIIAVAYIHSNLFIGFGHLYLTWICGSNY